MILLKPIVWLVGTRRELKAFPRDVQKGVGYALQLAQQGVTHHSCKPLKGFGGAGVLEVVSNFDGDTFRTVYTVRFSDAVYILSVFQKKSHAGRRTPKHETDLVDARLKRAEQLHKERMNPKGGK